jgi:hypothetical protein
VGLYFTDTYRPESELKYSDCLKRCHGFLLEELEPRSLLRDKEVSGIFHPVYDKIKRQSTRAAKVEMFLEFLRDQSEETIKLVMEKLKRKICTYTDSCFQMLTNTRI